MSAETSVKQSRLRAPERREKILAAALEVFSERGYSVSVGEIAAAAGVTLTVERRIKSLTDAVARLDDHLDRIETRIRRLEQP